MMKTPVVLSLAFVLAAAGLLAGSALRSRVVRPPVQQARDWPALVETGLRRGEPFPAVDLVDETGQRRLSTELLGAEGGVVLFLTLQCPPCIDASVRWQGFVDNGLLPASRVVGITIDPPDAIAAFRAEHGIAFAILQDRDHRFLTEYRVSHFPLELMVDGAGVMQQTGRDLAPPDRRATRVPPAGQQ